ncbi:MAG: metal-dependent hydrolase [Halolamina sp.]
MLFPTHLAIAVLLGRRVRLSTAWLLVGAALPDAVDKSLATLGVVDLFHTVGHSGLLVVLAIPVAYYGRSGLALAVGWGTHLLADAFQIVLNGRPTDALFLGWPIVVPPTPMALPPLSFARQYFWSPAFFVELVIWAALAAVVAADRRRRASE